MGHAERLAPGGLMFLGLVYLEYPIIPPRLATMAQGYFPDPTSLPRSLVNRDSPDFITRANRGWFDLAHEGGLFSDDREFLISVKIDKETGDRWWAHVRLAESWDIMGVGSAAGLGSGFGAPEFTMLSTTGNVIVFVTSDESRIGTVLLSGFQELVGLRKFAEWSADWPRNPQQERAAARRWLESLGK